MKEPNKLQKAKRNYYVDMASLLPFLLMIFTGIILLGYHAGKSTSQLTLSMSSNFWLNAHIVTSIITIGLVCVHLYQHISWFKKLFIKGGKSKKWIRNLILLILFIATTLTSLIPWLVMEDTSSSKLVLGLHNKFGLLLIIFFVIHVLSYSKWIVALTKNVFGKN
ncbi:DUF4405 domain-containing protein [Saccharicrinis aurantiacus]|uniref:DUF4405 domain-containing protein n=1 Tax=Saccharicrinis aurantiacus TaxID=1849719 RepID=UPI00094FD50B|nr:DUF4405 domain-containing protein [Saccharicrinis aurantiacus]